MDRAILRRSTGASFMTRLRLTANDTLFRRFAFLKKCENSEQGPDDASCDQVGRIVQPCGETDISQQYSCKQDRRTCGDAIRKKHRTDDESRGDVTAGKGMPFFLFRNHRQNAARFIRSFSVDDVAQDRHECQADRRKQDDAKKIFFRRASFRCEYDENQKSIGEKYACRKKIVSEDEQFFRRFMSPIKPGVFFIQFLIGVSRHEFSIAQSIKLCKSLKCFCINMSERFSCFIFKKRNRPKRGDSDGSARAPQLKQDLTTAVCIGMNKSFYPSSALPRVISVLKKRYSDFAAQAILSASRGGTSS